MEAVVTLRTPTSDNTPYASNSSILSDWGTSDTFDRFDTFPGWCTLSDVARRSPPLNPRGAPSRGCQGSGRPP